MSSSAPKNLDLQVVDRVFILVCGQEDPTDDEWAAFLAEVERHGVERTMLLFHTEGGAPSSSQRRAFRKLLDVHNVPIAVMTDSLRIRWWSAAMSWFSRWICAFPLNGLSDALAYLEVPGSRVDLMARKIAQGRRSLGRAPDEGARA